jgi:AcrR family transcriptional regulator
MPARRTGTPKPDPPQPLFPKLQPRRNGPSREHVAAHQRARLRGAVIEAAGASGFAATSVAELIALAGVSRPTFYEHFDSKEACFLASYERILADSAERIMAAYQREPDVLAALRGAYQAFVTELIENPQAARVVLVDMLALGSVAFERAERIRLGFEGALVDDPDLLGGFTLTPTVLTAVLSGVWQVARRRLLEDRLQELRGIGDELLLWIATYNSLAVERLRTQTLVIRDPPIRPSTQSTPTRGPSTPPRPASRDEPDPHKRMLRTAAELAARDGYHGLTAAQIIDEAHVLDETFFGSYENTEQCFIAALELRAAEVLATALRAMQGARDWADAVQLGIAALLEQMAGEPALASLAFIEVFTVGSAGVQLREALLQRIEALGARHAPGDQAPSGVVTEAIVGAVWGLIYDRVVRGEAHRLGELTEHASYIALAPVLGAEEAVERILAGPERGDTRESVAGG